MSTLPLAVTDHRAAGVLEIEWADGQRSRLAHARLRAGCRCAACTQARRLGSEPAAPPTLRLSALHAVGDQGLNLVFDDGHGRGIYPWAYLRELSTSNG